MLNALTRKSIVKRNSKINKSFIMLNKLFHSRKNSLLVIACTWIFFLIYGKKQKVYETIIKVIFFCMPEKLSHMPLGMHVICSPPNRLFSPRTFIFINKKAISITLLKFYSFFKFVSILVYSMIKVTKYTN